jgi:hypothetical protein
MSALRPMQQLFMDYLHDRPNHFLDTLADTGGLARDARANIYFNAYRVRLLDTLKDSFDKTWSWLGDERFEDAALRYIAQHPPTHFSLRPYGDRFADWLQSAMPDDAEVAELARLDWALRNAFDGADASPLTGDTLAGFGDDDWAQVVFRPHPTTQLLPLTHNTIALWHAMDREDTPPPAHRLARPATLLVWRKGLQPHFRSIDDAEAHMLHAMLRGERFADACESLAGTLPGDSDLQSLVGAFIARWLEEELLQAP